MPRWSLKERELLAEVRHRLRDELAQQPPYIEVVGDRRILRFLRGFKHNIDNATESYGKFLRWRRQENVDAVRQRIVEGGLDHPSKFPRGERILEMIPHLVITPNAKDKNNNLICAEGYNFKPAEVLAQIGLPDYLVFAIYCLEYRTLVVEQESEKFERAYLDSLSPEQRADALDPYGKSDPHGVILGTLVIRDIAAVGVTHCSEAGRQVIKAIVSVSSDNYPELLRRCYLINVPWIFDALWYFIKGMLAESTLKKIVICGKDFRELLDAELPRQLVPALIGGPYKGGMDANDPDSRYIWNRALLVEGKTLEADDRGLAALVATNGKGKEEAAASLDPDRPTTTELERHTVAAEAAAATLARKSEPFRQQHMEGASSSAGRFALLSWIERDPLWVAVVASYVVYFFVSGSWRSVLPFTLQILVVWAIIWLI